MMQGPSDATAQIWLQALVKPEHNGCGHIRLQLNETMAPYYSVKRNGPLAADVSNCVGFSGACISSTPIAQRIITKFFQ